MEIDQLNGLCRRNGYVYPRMLRDGRPAAVRTNLFNFSIVAGIDEYGCDDVFDYDTLAAASTALFFWTFTGNAEPAGWTRHMPSGRRGAGGDARLETVRE